MIGVGSQFRRDFLRISLSNGLDCEIQSFCGQVCVTLKNRQHAWLKSVDWDSGGISEQNRTTLLAHSRSTGEPFIPYWSLALGLGLISAWLILPPVRKPRTVESESHV
ncbi:MAG: hypothetical protein JSS49_28570 [Planctomycetes bacterium]|nr:hypothetical protein [Planctomycetota bacterium]